MRVSTYFVREAFNLQRHLDGNAKVNDQTPPNKCFAKMQVSPDFQLFEDSVLHGPHHCESHAMERVQPMPWNHSISGDYVFCTCYVLGAKEGVL